ncbi:MAG: hypothetical protein ACP5FK_00815 [bacterium]
MENLLTLFKSGELIPVLAFQGGVLIQCLSMLREKPPKWSVITFGGMLAYMVIMMVYAVFQTNQQYLAENLPNILSQQMISLGFVFAFLFIAIFLKSLIKIINESVIISITICYIFLIFESLDLMNIKILITALVLGLIFLGACAYLIITKTKINNFMKLIFYGWFLLVNGFLAVNYFIHLGIGYYELPSLVFAGKVSSFNMLIIGMITAQVLFNFGIIYYSFIYSLISKQTRDNLISYSENLFSDNQFSFKNIKFFSVLQILIFAAVTIFLSKISYQLIVLWILLSPLMVKIINFSIFSVQKRLQLN